MQVKSTNMKSSCEIIRPNLDRSLPGIHIDPFTLSTFQRILLTTDGTLTEILEAYFLEPITVEKLSEEAISTTKAILPLDLKEGCEVIERKILLQGKNSCKNYLYAESVLVPSRLDERFKNGLFESRTPIGKLWLENQIETFKEIINSSKDFAGNLGDYFHIQKEEMMLSRTYRVFSNHQPIMMITEKFPESYFLKDI